MQISDDASRYHVISSSLLSVANLSFGDTEKSRSFSLKNGPQFPLVRSLEYQIKNFQSSDEFSDEEKGFITHIRSVIKNHFPNATEKEKKAPIPRNGFAVGSTQMLKQSPGAVFLTQME
ncbi:MAG: hypothetical protein KR126chlam3_01111 [Chlamydiae bacterium]|nr:hypothetical protein [Chlamydiota bacterium]